MRGSIVAIGFLIGLALVVPAGPANAVAVPCFYIVKWTGLQACGCGINPCRTRMNPTIWSLECATGLGPGPTDTCEVSYSNAIDLSPGIACYLNTSPTSITEGPFLTNLCGGDKSAPSECKQGRATSDGSRDGSGLVGDPVDLTTGALSLDPVDVDLGLGLRFARHYASNATQLTSMGKKWSHDLEWRVTRTTPPQNGPPVILVKEPLRAPIPFFLDGATYTPSTTDGGSVAVDSGGVVHYISNTGTEADFDTANRVTEIRHPAELPIVVTYGTNSKTFTRGTKSLVISTNAAGRVSSVTGNGESWTYTYNINNFLTSVVGPDPSTSSPSDTATWTYVYTSATSGLITRVDRTTSAGTTTLGTWVFNGQRVSSADEQALDQPLLLTYSTPQTGILRATVKDSSSQLLALYDSRSSATADKGVVTAVTNPTGPAAPVPGGAGVPVPFVASTTIHSKSPLTKTRTDKNGNVTLFENYDGDGRPGRTIKGWVDGPTSPGVYSADDTFASLEEAVWHPILQEPLTAYSPSVLPGGGTRTTINDFDDPAAPGDNPLLPNQAPTSRLYSRTDQGYTLDASGAVVLAAYKTDFSYDTLGHLTSESGPRPENYTQHLYDPTTGHRTATRRYLTGPSSSYLETTFSNFDSLGNPQTITDPNLQSTLYTYDTLGRVKTVTPPFTGASSTITFTYDIDGNLTRIDFPPDSFSQPYFLRLGYDTKNKLTFLADAAGNAIVYERTAGRVTREALYGGFVSLASRGTLTGDSTFSYDAAGRLLQAFNPLVAGNAVFTQYASDPNSNPTSITDENGKQDTRLYDALDRLTQVSQVRGATTYVTHFAYDLQGRVKLVTDPAGKPTDHQHDDFGRLVKVTSPNTGVTLYLYDAAGNLVTKMENFAGTPRTTSYAYDGLDRLTLVDFPTDADWVFSYDSSSALNQKGRLASVGNGIVTTDREYTARGDLALERTTIGGASYEVAYGYDAGGNRTVVQAPSGVTAGYAFSGGRPKTLTVTAGAEQRTVRNIDFAPFGGRTRAEFPPYDAGTGLNTVISTRSYNLRGQVASLQVTSPAGTVLDQSFDYAYTAGGVGPVDPGPNLDRIIDNRDANESRFYFYDELDRFWKSTTLAGSSLYEYAYDANGNRTQETAPRGTTNTAYDASTDRIAQATGANAKSYAHDVYGSRIWAGSTAYAGLPTHLYNELNRLIEVRDPANQAVLGQYSYDAFGRRARKVTASGTTLFFYDAAGQMIEERTLATAPHSVRDYAWIDEEPAGVIDSGPQPTMFSWVHSDRLGTPLAVTSSPTAGNAQTIWRASHAPFGLAAVDQDPDGDTQQFAVDLRFPGQLWDSESGGHYNWHRYYDPSMGRYLEADPIGQSGGINVYAYVGNRPIQFSDPLGLFDPFTSFGDYAAEIYLGYRDLDRNRDELVDAQNGSADKYFHCKGHCEACKEGPGGELVSSFASPLKEVRDFVDGVHDREIASLDDAIAAIGDSKNDMRANSAGQAAAEQGAHCASACISRAPSNLSPRYSSEAQR